MQASPPSSPWTRPEPTASPEERRSCTWFCISEIHPWLPGAPARCPLNGLPKGAWAAGAGGPHSSITAHTEQAPQRPDSPCPSSCSWLGEKGKGGWRKGLSFVTNPPSSSKSPKVGENPPKPFTSLQKSNSIFWGQRVVKIYQCSGKTLFAKTLEV